MREIQVTLESQRSSEAQEPQHGGSLETLDPMFKRLCASLAELDLQMRGEKPAPTEDETKLNNIQSELNAANERIANMLIEREDLAKKLSTAIREFHLAMDVVQKQRGSLVDAEVATQRLESTTSKLKDKLGLYQKTIALLLNMPPQAGSVK